MNLKKKSSYTPVDCLPVEIFKSIAHIISPHLSEIVNLSFTQGIFPSSLKIAKIVPIFKDGDRTEVNNYRPISILPIFSKTFEKIIFKRVYSFSDHFSILHKDQFGFRNNRSTSQAIIGHLQYLYDNIDNDNVVFSMFLDFRKAFDTVDIDILLLKLHYYGIRGIPLSLFKSYLSGRMQYTTIQGASSEQLSN